jgi:tol-pal system protein YbgF
VRWTPAGAALVALAVLGVGCASRADLVRQERQLRSLVLEQRKQIQSMQRELERLRGEVEEGRGGSRSSAGSEARIAELQARIAELEGKPPPGEPPAPGSPPPGTPPPAGATGPVAAVPPSAPPTTPPPTTPPAAPPPVEDDAWRRDVAREQNVAGAVNVPERGEYLGLLDGLAQKDCARSVGQLNGFAAKYKDSPLADNALYWTARCYAVRGDQNQAISKFYDVVTRYPKGDKAPAALLAQGNLFVDIGDSPDARLAFSKLIRDYPNSEEAARARQRLSELED